MVKDFVKILDINNSILGTGLLLDRHVATVDHILNNEINYFIEVNGDIYSALVIFRGKDLNIPVDIAMLSVDIRKNYKPDVIEVSMNDEVEIKGFPKEPKYAIYPDGRHISGKVISFNYIDVSNIYPYCGNFITISSTEEISVGFSGAPVFVGDNLAGLVARKHIDNKPNNFNIVPASYFLDADNGNFRSLFGKCINFERPNTINKPKKSLINPFHFRSESIDFVGRDEQIDQLFQFCSSEPDIQWWAITGVGGIGKSRLAYEFAKSLNENIWDSMMLSTYDYESLQMKSANIKKNTFIVLDYVQQNIRDIGKWLYALSENEFHYKVRVILLERQGKSYKTSKWIERLNERNCEYDVLINTCYNPSLNLDPPFLVLSSLSRENLVSISQNYSDYNNVIIDDSTIQDIIKQLSILDPGFNRPLYLIFLIDTWLCNGNLSKWNKTFILDNVLTRELHRIKLIIKNVIDDDLLIKAYFNVLVYATIMDGLKYPNEFKCVCSDELKVFEESIKYYRKDIFELFRQVGFLTEDNEGNLLFEGLKPDLLGEYFIFSYNKNTAINNIVQQSLAFPLRAYNFYHRLLDDYSAETDSNFRYFLINIDTNSMSIEQLYYYAEFLCERIARDNRRHSEQCLERLNSFYTQNKSKDNAIIYAIGLSNMIEQLNLKRSKRLLLELNNLYIVYNDSLEIAIEYAYSLIYVIERKSLRASQKDFENLKILCKRDIFIEELEMNLCYVKALKILCSKAINSYIVSEYCKELKFYSQKFQDNEEFTYIYAQSLSSLNITSDKIDRILSELLSLCYCVLVLPVYGTYVFNKFKAGIIQKEKALYWLNNKYDFRLYINKINEYPNENINVNAYAKHEEDIINSKQENIINSKPEDVIISEPNIEFDIDIDLDKAKKLAWLSNNLNYKQCKGVVEELKALYERHKNTFDFPEYYLIGIVTLSGHSEQNLTDLYELLKSILEISNELFDNFNEGLRISIYDSVTKLEKYNLFTDELLALLNSFISIITMELRSEEETFKIMTLLLATKNLIIDDVTDEYFERVILYHYGSERIQKQYIKYLEIGNICNSEYIFKNFSRFYNLNCSIIVAYLANKILTFLSYKDVKVIDYIADFLSKNRTAELANVYSEVILRLFLENPSLEYYNQLNNLEIEYRPNIKIALNYAKLLFVAGEKGLLDNNELHNRFMELDKNYSNKSIVLLYQKMLSKMIAASTSNSTFTKYINRQRSIFNSYGTLELAVEYCNSLSVVSSFISESENNRNLIRVKNIAMRFKNMKAFNPCLKIIINEIKKSRELLYIEEVALENTKLSNLKSQIQYLHCNMYKVNISQVEIVANRAREAYQEIPTIDFAIQLCKVLSLLSKLVSNGVLYEIVEEVEKIYNCYPSEPSVFKYYLIIFEQAILNNCKLENEKIDKLEKLLVLEIKENIKCDTKVYTILLLILHDKNAKNNNAQLIDLQVDSVTIPTAYAYTQPSKQKINSILYHFHVWGTLDKPIEIIIVKNYYILLDGYARWFVAVKNNIRSITAKILAKY